MDKFKVKEQKGSITLFILIAIIFFIFIVVGMYTQILNKKTAQEKEIKMLESNYEETRSIDEIYNEVADNITNISKLEVTLSANTTAWTSGNVTLTGKAKDEGSVLLAYQFSTDPNLAVNSEGWVNISDSKTEITQTYAATANGTYYFYVKDRVGNFEKSQIEVKNIDKEAPTKTTVDLDGYASGTWTAGNVTQTANATDKGSGVAYYQYTHDKISISAFSNPWTITFDGNWTFYVRAVDHVGNIGEWSEPYIIKRDSVKPTILSYGVSSGNSPHSNGWYNTDVYFQFSLLGGASMYTFHCWCDGQLKTYNLTPNTTNTITVGPFTYTQSPSFAVYSSNGLNSSGSTNIYIDRGPTIEEVSFVKENGSIAVKISSQSGVTMCDMIACDPNSLSGLVIGAEGPFSGPLGPYNGDFNNGTWRNRDSVNVKLNDDMYKNRDVEVLLRCFDQAGNKIEKIIGILRWDYGIFRFTAK